MWISNAFCILLAVLTGGTARSQCHGHSDKIEINGNTTISLSNASTSICHWILKPPMENYVARIRTTLDFGGAGELKLYDRDDTNACSVFGTSCLDIWFHDGKKYTDGKCGVTQTNSEVKWCKVTKNSTNGSPLAKRCDPCFTNYAYENLMIETDVCYQTCVKGTEVKNCSQTTKVPRVIQYVQMDFEKPCGFTTKVEFEPCLEVPDASTKLELITTASITDEQKSERYSSTPTSVSPKKKFTSAVFSDNDFPLTIFLVVFIPSLLLLFIIVALVIVCNRNKRRNVNAQEQENTRRPAASTIQSSPQEDYQPYEEIPDNLPEPIYLEADGTELAGYDIARPTIVTEQTDSAPYTVMKSLTEPIYLDADGSELAGYDNVNPTSQEHEYAVTTLYSN